MNLYLGNLKRVEFVVTYACTGRCKHCSQGDHTGQGAVLDGERAAGALRQVAGMYRLQSVMTFGGEPLLHPEVVCRIHAAAAECGIPARQMITNGFFARDPRVIEKVAGDLAGSGVNDILLSVDAFHQETIPLEPVKRFAEAVRAEGVQIRTQPAWIKGSGADNPYDRRTGEILCEFQELGIEANDGNVIFPAGNARRYLGEYFDLDREWHSPYEEDPEDVRALSFDPEGNVLGGNVYREEIQDILSRYTPSLGGRREPGL